MKLQTISTTTLNKFLEAKKQNITVHDLDLRRWALASAREIQCSNFKASNFWLYNFKKAHHIVSRKVTKFVSKTDVRVGTLCFVVTEGFC